MISHSQLINIAHVLGYKSISDEGMCRGFSSMWTQAVCCNDLKTFNNRLNLLSEFAESPQKLREAIGKTWIKAKKKGVQNLTSQEQILYEIPAFFEGIALYLNPEIGQEMTGNYSFLSQHDYQKISPYLLPQFLEKSSDTISRDAFTLHQYDQKSLQSLLQTLGRELAARDDVPILFGANNHSVAIRVIGEDQFEFWDINSLDESKNILNCQELAIKLNQVFDFGNLPAGTPLQLKTEIYARQNKPLPPGMLQRLKPEDKLQYLAKDKFGATILHGASQFNLIDTYQRIDYSVIDINQTDIEGLTALDTAIIFNSKDVINFLSTIPSLNVNISNSGRSPLERILKSIEVDLSIVRKIIEHPSFEPKLSNRFGDSYLHHLCFLRTEDCSSLAEQLIEAGTEIDKQNRLGFTALLGACKMGNLHLVKTLLKHGANPNIQDNRGFTPLHHALIHNDKLANEIVKLLLDNGADCHHKAKNGMTALSIACLEHRMDLIPLLLNNTSQLSMNDISPSSYVYKAIQVCHPTVQMTYLKKALQSYLVHRDAEAEYLNIFHAGFSKEQKIESAKALLAKINGDDSIDLRPYHKVLNNGRISSLYRLYIDDLCNKSSIKGEQNPQNQNKDPKAETEITTHVSTSQHFKRALEAIKHDNSTESAAKIEMQDGDDSSFSLSK